MGIEAQFREGADSAVLPLPTTTCAKLTISEGNLGRPTTSRRRPNHLTTDGCVEVVHHGAMRGENRSFFVSHFVCRLL